MSRPKGSLNKSTIAANAAASNGKFSMGGGAPITPAIEEPKVTILPTVEPKVKNVALGKNKREYLLRVAIGGFNYFKSSNGNLVFKGRMVDENGMVWMTTMAMPLNPATGRSFPIDAVDLDTL